MQIVYSWWFRRDTDDDRSDGMGGGRWGWSVWSTRALESLNNEQGVNSRTSMFCDVDDDADDSHVHHRRRNFRMIPEWKFRFFGRDVEFHLWIFIKGIRYSECASTYQPQQTSYDIKRISVCRLCAFARSNRNMNLYIAQLCVWQQQNIAYCLFIAYVSHERPFSANDVEDEKCHIDAWMLPLPFFNNSTYGRTKHHNQV